MSKVIKSNDAGIGGQLQRQTSKIKEYKLEEDLVNLKIKGYASSRIAKELNKILEARPENTTYLEIKAQNVIQYLNSHNKALMEGDPGALATLANTIPDVGEKLNVMVSTIEDEISKIRNDDSPIMDSKHSFFIRLLQELRSTIELAATISGKLQPQVAIAIFNNLSSNVEKLAKKVQDSKTLTDEAKFEVMGLIETDLLNEDLLKSVPGKVIDVTPKKEIEEIKQ